MMSQNEKGFKTEQFCAWVPCIDYLRARKRERETKKHYHKEYQNIEMKKVHMHEQCMSM